MIVVMAKPCELSEQRFEKYLELFSVIVGMPIGALRFEHT